MRPVTVGGIDVTDSSKRSRIAADEQGPRRLSDAIDAYLNAKRIRCSPRTIELEEERLSIVKKQFGDVPLSAITATTIADFQRARHDAGIANRTINMDVGVLSRVLKFCGRWRALADHVHNLPERQRPIGRAPTAEERRRLFDTAASNPAAALRSNVLIRRILCAVVCVLLVARLAAALEVQVKNLHAPASVVTTTIELRDVLPDRFKKTLEGGGILHLRVQAELWESRRVWDRLVYPAIVRVFRFTRGATDGLSITDPSGATTTYPAPPRSVPVIVDLGDTRRLTATERYYVHVIATLGTLAEREVNEVGDAVFGRESETNSLGSLAKLVFRTVLQVSDYLQTVSAETRSRRTAGADMLKPASP
jgi:integrase